MQKPQETKDISLGQEDPLEEEMATHSSILAWRIPWTQEPSGLQSMGLQRVRYDLATKHAYMIDFSSVAMKVLDCIFFQDKAVSPTLEICCLAYTPFIILARSYE